MVVDKNRYSICSFYDYFTYIFVSVHQPPPIASRYHFILRFAMEFISASNFFFKQISFNPIEMHKILIRSPGPLPRR
jgi:hypothetical protein